MQLESSKNMFNHFFSARTDGICHDVWSADVRSKAFLPKSQNKAVECAISREWEVLIVVN